MNMHLNLNNASIAETDRGTHSASSQDEIILTLAEEISTLEKRYTALDEAKFLEKRNTTRSLEETYREIEQSHTADRIYALREALSALQASSIQAAVVQLAIANTIVADMAGNEHSENDMGKLERSYDRLIHSAMTILLQDAHLDHEDYGINHLMSFNRNPWVAYEDHVETLSRELNDPA